MTAAMTDTDWRTRGACRDDKYDPDWWHATGADLQLAVWVCQNACPVAADCYEWADRNRSLARGAVYGGVSWALPHHGTDIGPSRRQPVPRRPGRADTDCGSQAAVSRHRRRGEPLDLMCLAVDADRKRRDRSAA